MKNSNRLVVGTNLKDFSKSIRDKSRAINRFRKAAPRITAKQLKDATDATLIKRIKSYLITNKIIFTKQLYNAIQAVVVKQGWTETAVEIQAPGVPYAMDVEQGLKPGTKQDYHKLVKWAQFKLGLNYRGAQKAASRIRRKIEKEGTKEKPFIRVPMAGSKVALFNRFMKNLQNNIKLN